MDSTCPAASCIASQSSDDFGEAFNTTFTQMWDTLKRTNRMLLSTLTTAFVRCGYGVRGRSSGVGSALISEDLHPGDRRYRRLADGDGH